ncbi:MAG: mannose-1-phosphate guanylyltransferase, partial [Arachnia sp.]
MQYVVILAGGSGTRLWPLSRQGTPKQFLELFSGRSLLRLAFERLDGVVDPDHILVCTSRDHAELVRRQLPELPPENLLGEPQGRDSLGAVAWSAAYLAERDPGAVVAMVTADHLIEPVDEFRRRLTVALGVARDHPDALVTMGVVPDSPHTGYGYLRRGAPVAGQPGTYQIAEFREKPDETTAGEYVASGQYWWNSGIFAWRTSALLGALRRALPEEAAKVELIAREPGRLDEVFATLVKTSVDYAIMEPASRGELGVRVLAVA